METALYYTFSTLAQALGATIAFLAAVALYTLNAIDAYCKASASALEAQTGGGVDIRVAAIEGDWTRVALGVRNRLPNVAYLAEEAELRLGRLDQAVRSRGRVLVSLGISIITTALVILLSIVVLAYVPQISSGGYSRLVLSLGILATSACLFADLGLARETFRGSARAT